MKLDEYLTEKEQDGRRLGRCSTSQGLSDIWAQTDPQDGI